MENVVGDQQAIPKDAVARISFLRWWRLLDYDPGAAEFLRKLDMPDELADQLITRE